jgi:hypothetical protein
LARGPKPGRGAPFCGLVFPRQASEAFIQHELPPAVWRSSCPWARPPSTASRRWLNTLAPRSRCRFRCHIHAHHVAASSAPLAMAMPNQRPLVLSSHVLVDPLTSGSSPGSWTATVRSGHRPRWCILMLTAPSSPTLWLIHCSYLTQVYHKPASHTTLLL